ncbi:formyltransferase family protein [Spiribacter roseus]|uniref:phosphoribosylglycinamide formyltransferase 1 n=1 Tax=Spiribacter roseus TaxID=1855875 RepID=A0ABV3RZQ4_9GAMM
MNTGFIAYDTNHLKSDQVLNQWFPMASEDSLKGSKVFLVPFKPRPARETVFTHRPAQSIGGHPDEMAQALGLSVEHCESTDQIPHGMDAYVVLGVGLLPDDFVEMETVVNAHPGLIPYSRGLDSFKWAIYNQRPVGVTLHRLSPEVDMGAVWCKRETPVLPNDTLKSFARRHYELEISVLSRFEMFLNSEPEPVDPNEAVPATKRMPAEKEKELWEAFQRYKVNYGK